MPWEPSTREIETLSEEAAPDSVTGKCFSTVDPMQIYFLWISQKSSKPALEDKFSFSIPGISNMGMDQYLYIPFLGGWTSI